MVISTHLPPPVIIDNTAVLALVTHILCRSWAMCFSAAASSEKVHGSANLASNTAPLPSTLPSRVAAIHRLTGWKTRRCTSRTVVAAECVFESPQRENLGSDSFSARRVTIAAKSLGGHICRKRKNQNPRSVTQKTAAWPKSRQLVPKTLRSLLLDVKRRWLRRMRCLGSLYQTRGYSDSA